MLRLFVVGHPHSGTTILRKIIGLHPRIVDCPHEVRLPLNMATAENSASRHTCLGFVCKCPVVDLRGEEFLKREDIRTVAIIRDVRDVAVSMRPRNYTLERVKGMWLRVNSMFDRLVSDSFRIISYEHLFEPEHLTERFGELFTWLGLDFDDKYVLESHEHPQRINSFSPPEEEPDRTRQGYFRAWQTNQPVGYFTGRYRGAMTEEDERELMGDPAIRVLMEKYVLAGGA
jgi:hypothetical protein